MYESREPTAELRELLDALREDAMTAAQADRLTTLLRDDFDARRTYLHYMAMVANLRDVLSGPHASVFVPASDEGRVAALQSSSRMPTMPTLPGGFPVVDSFSTFPSSFSTFAFSYLVAAVLVGLGLTIAALTHISSEPTVRQVVRNDSPLEPATESVSPRFESVGRITGVVECQWSLTSGQRNLKSEIGNTKSPVCLGDHLDVRSGLLEITYDTGAKVLLQGPATYEVESAVGGYLAIGKLTARLEGGKNRLRSPARADKPQDEGHVSLERQQTVLTSGDNLSEGEREPNQRPASGSRSPVGLFAVRTPTAVVTDLGTEFGVEVNGQGCTTSQVFQGRVLLETQARKTAATRKVELTVGDSATVEQPGEVAVRRSRGRAPADTKRFIRAIPTLPPSTLLAYWPMDEGRGRGAFDRSRNRINCWFSGDAEWATGRFGGAVHLSGNESYLTAIKSPTLNLGTEDFTISLWFKGGSTKNWRWLFDYNGEGTASDPSLVISTYIVDGKTDSHLRISLGAWFTDVYSFEGTPTLNSSTEWYHVAVTRQGKTLVGYVNGTPVFSGAVASVNLVLNNALHLGSLNTSHDFSGDLDDVAIWRQALTATQVRSLAEGTATPLDIVSVSRAASQKDSTAGSNAPAKYPGNR